MINPYFDPKHLEEWRERISRLRVLSDIPAPWDVDPDVEHWKQGLGSAGFFDRHMLEWQVWLHSRTPEQQIAYQKQHPEPHGWGLYELAFKRPTFSAASESKGSEIYWDLLEKHYEKLFGVA